MADGSEQAETQEERWARIAVAHQPFADHLGIRQVSATPMRVVTEMDIKPFHLNRNGVLHGGAVMGFADNVGGTAAFLNLPPGASTTTIESKTNFFRAVAAGETVRAECAPLHVGRTTMVFRTDIYRQDGQLAATVTQTQLVMQKR